MGSPPLSPVSSPCNHRPVPGPGGDLVGSGVSEELSNTGRPLVPVPESLLASHAEGASVPFVGSKPVRSSHLVVSHHLEIAVLGLLGHSPVVQHHHVAPRRTQESLPVSKAKVRVSVFNCGPPWIRRSVKRRSARHPPPPPSIHMLPSFHPSLRGRVLVPGEWWPMPMPMPSPSAVD